jgi:large subunit ribosomal protein L21
VSDQAIIRTGGKQYRVEVGNKLKVEKLDGEVGSTINIDDVLLVGNGDKVKIGTPVVSGANVTADIVGQGRHKKVIVYKFRRRKQYRRKRGHRQYYTELKITGIKG